MKFVKPLILGNNSYFVCAELNKVLNKKHKNFGQFTISMDMQYNPFHEHKLADEYLTKQQGIDLLNELGFIQVKHNFDEYNVEDIIEIKNILPKEWFEIFESWLEYVD